jgi:phosphohistidine phosphatase
VTPAARRARLPVTPSRSAHDHPPAVILGLVRHGIAEDPGPSTGFRDEPRRLTPRGIERMRAAAAGIAALGLSPEVVLSSPLRRCAETATIISDRLAVPVRTVEALRPGARAEGLLDVLAEYPDAGSVLACGHQPDMSLVLADLIGGGMAEFRKGTLALVDVHRPRPGGGVLVGLHPPRVLRRLGRG